MAKTIGKYEIENTVGSGAMGVVYRARDPIIDRIVAIKVLSPALLENPRQRERFYQEARTAGALRHPNVVVIYDCGEHEGVPFIVMEFLEGEDLRDSIARQVDWSLDRKLGIGLQICRGLKHAHEKGIIHRDMKPGNVRVLPDGTVRILDFGIARLADAAQTQTSSLMGTVSYMAPEQCLSGQATASTDIWAVGIILYELFSGHRPFEAAHNVAVIHKIVSEEAVPLSVHWPDCPKALEEIVGRAINKDPRERYSDVDHLREALENFRRTAHAAQEETLYSADRLDLSHEPAATVWAPLESETQAGGAHAATQSGIPTRSTEDFLGRSLDGRPEPAAQASTRVPVGLEAVPAESQSLVPPIGEASTSSPAANTGRKWFVWSLPVLVVALGIGAWLIFRPATEATKVAVESNDIKPRAEAVAATAIRPAGLAVQAFSLNILPWAEIVEVRDQKGNPVPGLTGKVTPLRLSLIPGTYSLRLRNREVSTEDFNLKIEVPNAQSQAITQVFPGFDVERAAAAFQ